MDVGKIIERHFVMFKKKSKFSPPDNLKQYEHLVCNKSLACDLDWVLNLRIGRLKKKSVLYPYRNTSGFKL